MRATGRRALAAALVLAACGGSPDGARAPAPLPASSASGHHAPSGSPRAQAHGAGDEAAERALDEVAQIHGAPGPWAVAGYRMSMHALAKLGLPRGSFDLEIVHTSPREVQLSCIADGAAA